MTLSALTDRSAVLRAVAEYDELGRDAFLKRYGYGPSKSYFMDHGGKEYDSKAIVGAAYGKQFPDLGPLRSGDFSGGDTTVRAKLESLGFRVKGPADSQPALITSEDIALLRSGRSRDRYADLSPEERAAYERVQGALKKLGGVVKDELGNAEYELRLTSGYHVQSGVRGAIPKDLWFGVYRRENDKPFLGNPQLFAIASGSGLEFGFYASTHPADFSNADLKAKLRAVAPVIYRQLPLPESRQAAELERMLGSAWSYRAKARLDPANSAFSDLSSWLRHFKSLAGQKNGGGGITRWIIGEQLDQTDTIAAMREMARTFRSLMSSIRAGVDADPRPDPTRPPVIQRPFAILFEELLVGIQNARAQPFGEIPALWALMNEVQTRFHATLSIRKRRSLNIKWSLGRGGWANVPWIAVLNSEITTSIQNGVYIVLLIAEDLSSIYVTLNQGTTDLVNERGQTAANRILQERAEAHRAQLSHLASTGISLSNNLDLRSGSWRAKSYEAATIAYVRLDRGRVPSDARFEEILETFFSAYDQLGGTPSTPLLPEIATEPDPLPDGEDPYSVEDAASGLFISRSEVERILATWRTKKNLILQGPPGVGKSFVARRLAFALMGYSALSRVETVQFHQSYGYEDFVQGYRPTDSGGFTLRQGAFMKFCAAAVADPERDYVIVIDEINRGNLSKILGELMVLIEPDKRNAKWALRLAYAQASDPRFHVPENVFMLGMMNTADRSLSMVDYAMRRRFAFFSLSPQFASPAFAEHLLEFGVSSELVDIVRARMTELNDAIAKDTINLGPGFQIGHSFFVSSDASFYSSGWYNRVVESEIVPLLDEYWFDDPKKAAIWRDRLLAT